MQIKPQALGQYLLKKLSPLYVLTGQDPYLLEDSLSAIKIQIKKQYDCDEKLITVESAADWKELIHEASSYSLFSDATLLNIVYDKKSLDVAGKKVLGDYLQANYTNCFCILRASNVPAKQLTWLSNLETVTMVVAYPLNAEAMKIWISNELKKHSLRFSPDVPRMIHHYTQGNMLACAQTIEKISLSNAKEVEITESLALEHLSNQCEHSLYELVDACLGGQIGKAIQILRQASTNKTEAILVLWMLSQEIRVLMQLHFLLAKNLDFKSAAAQLKIWPQKYSLYQLSLQRVNSAFLQQLLSYCQVIDEQIKSNLNHQAWNALERLAIMLSGHSESSRFSLI